MNVMKEYEAELARLKSRYTGRDLDEDSKYKVSESVMGNMELLDRIRAYEAMVRTTKRDEERYSEDCLKKLRDEVEYKTRLEFNLTAQKCNRNTIINHKIIRVCWLVLTICAVTEVFFK